MKLSLSEPGIILSGIVHAGALALLLIAFSEAKPLPEQHEAVPVETISNADFAALQGNADSPSPLATAPPPADTIADKTDSTPDASKPVAAKDNPAPPPPPAPPEPVKDETPPPAPPPPPPPEPLAPPPPPPPPVRPEKAEAPPPPDVPLPPVQPAPPPPAPLPPQRALPDAETIAPTPPPKPQPPKPVKVVEPKPTPPPPPPKPVEAKPPPPKPVEAKAPPKLRPEKPKPDLLAKLLDQPAQDRPIHKAIAHPKPADPQPEQRQFDPTDISKLLSSAEPPSQKVSTGRQLSKTKIFGAQNGAAPRMTASISDQLDGLLMDQYLGCWSYLDLNGPKKYIPQIKVVYSEDGSLAGEPVLINPPADPAMRGLAESAMRAVRKCNPLKIPAQFLPYYDEWRARILRFDPIEMQG